MKVFFDNNSSPVLANVLNAFISADNDSACHIRYMPPDSGLSGSSTDFEWIGYLSKNDAKSWMVITSDRIHRSKPEREAWRRAGLRGFVFESAFQKKMPMNRWASILLWKWPDMRAHIERSAPGSLYALPVQKNAGFRALAG